MSYNSQRMPTYAAYGGVLQDAAYGGIPTEEAYRLAREKKEREEKKEQNNTLLADNRYSKAFENFGGLSPKSYVDDLQIFSTDYNWNHPITSDAKNYNTMHRNYLHSKPIDYSLYGDGFSEEFINQMNKDNRFQNALQKYVIPHEGGYVNHPNDRGKETNYGITSRWYPNEDIKNLSRERANALLYRDYWKKTNIYQLPDELAYIVFDNSIVQGQPTAIKNLQKALNVKADGLIGPDTIRSLKNSDYNLIKNQFINNAQKIEDQYIQNDPSQKVFENGHRNRFNSYY